MTETYTFQENEYITENVITKLNDGYYIKEIRFELDYEIIPEDEHKYSSYISNDIESDNSYYLHFLNKFYTHYSNNLILKIDPFVENNILDSTNYKIKLHKCFKWIEEEQNIREYKRLHYKRCHITLYRNNIFKGTIRNDNYIENDKIIITSNYFNNIDELKKYFIDITETNEEVYNNWFDDNYFDTYSYYINLKTIDKLEETIIYEKEIIYEYDEVKN